MGRSFPPTLGIVTIALTIACSSVSDSDASFWEPSRDLGGKGFGGFTPPTGAGGASGDAGSSSGAGPGAAGGEAGASGTGGVAGTGVAGAGGTVAGSGGDGGTNGGTGAGGTGGAGNVGGAGGGAGGGGAGGGSGGTGATGSGGTGAGGSGPSTTCTLTFDFTTVTYRGRFGPKNVGAVWVMSPQNQFVKTLEVWAGIRANNLVNWQRQARGSRVDAVTGATISTHRAHQSRWDCRDASGNVVPNGQYKMFLEFTEDDSALFFNPQPKLFSFDFEKGAGPATISPPNQPNFTSMTLTIQ